MKPEIHIAHRFPSLSPERARRGARILSSTLYLLLALVALMELGNPGMVRRISAQGAGRVLLLVVAALLLLMTALAFGNVISRQDSTLQAGFGDALLHLAIAIGGLDLAVGSRILSVPEGAILVAGLGVLLFSVGLVVALWSFRPLELDTNAISDWRARELRAIHRRDYRVRGSVFAVLGGFLAAASAHAGLTADHTVAHAPWRLPLLVASAAALGAYGLHALWILRQEERLWLS